MSAPKGLPPLSQDQVRIASKGRVSIAVNAISRLNAQHERLTGGPAPGDAIRTYRGHDHCQDGGAVLCRGTLFSLDVGGIGNGSYNRHTILSTSTWESIMGASPGRPYMFRTFPTPGITGTLAAALVVRTYGAAIDIRVTNLTTGTSSTHATSNAATPTWQGAIADVPMSAGRENQFDIEVRGTAADQIDLLAFVLYEDTTNNPSTNGTTTYSSL